MNQLPGSRPRPFRVTEFSSPTMGEPHGAARSGHQPAIASIREARKRGDTGMTTRDTDWDGVRLHVVTGKGGTGKTTVAAALALALAHGGHKVLLMETEGRQGIA